MGITKMFMIFIIYVGPTKIRYGRLNDFMGFPHIFSIRFSLAGFIRRYTRKAALDAPSQPLNRILLISSTGIHSQQSIHLTIHIFIIDFPLQVLFVGTPERLRLTRRLSLGQQRLRRHPTAFFSRSRRRNRLYSRRRRRLYRRRWRTCVHHRWRCLTC